MTDSYPTREEIAAILAGDDDIPQESDYRFADQILARLRPAWEPKQVVCTKCGYIAVEQNVRDHFETLRADLRACAEALKDALSHNCLHEKARAALARPGVRDALK